MTLTPTVGTAAEGSPLRLVRALALTTFLLWLGASALLPLLPLYLDRRGHSDTLVGVVMAAFFAAAVLTQYPAGRLADRVGRRPVLVGGLLVYAAGSFAFLAPVPPLADIALRALQGVGSGAAEVAALAMISAAVDLPRRGRAFGSIYAAQLGAMAIGPLVGSVVGVGSMDVVFSAAGAAALAACVPPLRDGRFAGHGAPPVEATATRGRVTRNRAMTGALVEAAAFGLVIGVYEACWTLLLESRHAHDWQIGLSWTLFAAPFVAMSRPGGWLADHADRRWLVVASTSVSIGCCCLYPFLHELVLLLTLGGVEALAMAVALPSAQSLLAQASPAAELGRVQGLFATYETGAIALSAAAAGTLFGLAVWAPFVAAGSLAAMLTAALPVVWRPVSGQARAVAPVDPRPRHGTSPADAKRRPPRGVAAAASSPMSDELDRADGDQEADHRVPSEPTEYRTAPG